MWAISQCPQQQVLLKLGGACKDRTGGTHHKRTTIKHEVVLTAYLVRIHQGGAQRCCPLCSQVDALLTFAFFIRGTIQRDQEVNIFVFQVLHWAAVLPNVLTDREPNTVSTHSDDRRGVPRSKIRYSSNTP